MGCEGVVRHPPPRDNVRDGIEFGRVGGGGRSQSRSVAILDYLAQERPRLVCRNPHPLPTQADRCDAGQNKNRSMPIEGTEVGAKRTACYLHKYPSEATSSGRVAMTARSQFGPIAAGAVILTPSDLAAEGGLRLWEVWRHIGANLSPTSRYSAAGGVECSG